MKKTLAGLHQSEMQGHSEEQSPTTTCETITMIVRHHESDTISEAGMTARITPRRAALLSILRSGTALDPQPPTYVSLSHTYCSQDTSMMKSIVSSSLVGLVRGWFDVCLQLSSRPKLGVGGCGDGANGILAYDAIMSKHNLLSESNISWLLLQ